MYSIAVHVGTILTLEGAKVRCAEKELPRGFIDCRLTEVPLRESRSTIHDKIAIRLAVMMPTKARKLRPRGDQSAASWMLETIYSLFTSAPHVVLSPSSSP